MWLGVRQERLAKHRERSRALDGAHFLEFENQVRRGTGAGTNGRLTALVGLAAFRKRQVQRATGDSVPRPLRFCA